MTLPAVTVLAASLLGSCQLPGAQRRACVDPAQRVLNEIECRRPGGIGRWYYYHGSSSGFGTGSHISGGSYTSHGSSGGVSASHVGRGGFGGHSSGG